jgi:hypothetical protein
LSTSAISKSFLLCYIASDIKNIFLGDSLMKIGKEVIRLLNYDEILELADKVIENEAINIIK